MKRRHRDYGDRSREPVAVEGAVDISAPVAGFYSTRLRSGGVMVGIELRYGPPLDPVTGEELDRSWRWIAFANGEPVEFDDVWPKCAAEPITEADYRGYIGQQGWARKYAPRSAHADPRRKRDPFSDAEPLPF